MNAKRNSNRRTAAVFSVALAGWLSGSIDSECRAAEPLGLTKENAAEAPVAAPASPTLRFSNYDWIVRRTGTGGPGPNQWDENHVWVDERGDLHLKLAPRNGKWCCAELQTRDRLGFGRYQFRMVGRIDELDPNVVFGLFNYPTADVGSDATNELDIEFARWGNKEADVGNYTVWPVAKGKKQTSKTFSFQLSGDYTTHRFMWSKSSVAFQSLHGHGDDDKNQFADWRFQPDSPVGLIGQKPMPLHINLWCFKGQPPKNGKPVDLVVRSFTFTPE